MCVVEGGSHAEARRRRDFGVLDAEGAGIKRILVISTGNRRFTGAEIEAVFIDALHEAYADGREPRAKDILAAMITTVPLAQLMDGQISELRHWAKGRAREAATRSNTTPPTSSRPSRRMSEMN